MLLCQVGVTLLYAGVNRILNRGGGPDNNDQLRYWTVAENCTELCYWGMMFGGEGNEWYQLPRPGVHDPHYLKCFLGPLAAPPNGLRIQTASQLNTFNIDPLVPQMNITDIAACLRTFLIL